jgi:hypothetical protein
MGRIKVTCNKCGKELRNEYLEVEGVVPVATIREFLKGAPACKCKGR